MSNEINKMGGGGGGKSALNRETNKVTDLQYLFSQW